MLGSASASIYVCYFYPSTGFDRSINAEMLEKAADAAFNDNLLR